MHINGSLLEELGFFAYYKLIFVQYAHRTKRYNKMV